jgi:mono/diheme cytochrome c family protein
MGAARWWRAAGLAAALAAAGACRQDMHDAPRYDPLESSAFFADGASARMLVDGTIARGTLVEDELLATGKIGGQPADQFPFTVTAADLDRGEQRFDIYCAPCHGRTGQGNGMIVQRGYRTPPDFHSDRLRQAPAGHYVDVIANGFGAMPDYAAQVVAEDRWRIAAYIRALQLTRQGTAADVPAPDLARLQAGAAAPAAETPASEPAGGQR